ncbi:unnamed protein product, partial [Discosporangium mesarthrocarpum]
MGWARFSAEGRESWRDEPIPLAHTSHGLTANTQSTDDSLSLQSFPGSPAASPMGSVCLSYGDKWKESDGSPLLPLDLPHQDEGVQGHPPVALPLTTSPRGGEEVPLQETGWPAGRWDSAHLGLQLRTRSGHPGHPPTEVSIPGAWLDKSAADGRGGVSGEGAEDTDISAYGNEGGSQPGIDNNPSGGRGNPGHGSVIPSNPALSTELMGGLRGSGSVRVEGRSPGESNAGAGAGVGVCAGVRVGRGPGADAGTGRGNRRVGIGETGGQFQPPWGKEPSALRVAVSPLICKLAGHPPDPPPTSPLTTDMHNSGGVDASASPNPSPAIASMTARRPAQKRPQPVGIPNGREERGTSARRPRQSLFASMTEQSRPGMRVGAVARTGGGGMQGTAIDSMRFAASGLHAERRRVRWGRGSGGWKRGGGLERSVFKQDERGPGGVLEKIQGGGERGGNPRAVGQGSSGTGMGHFSPGGFVLGRTTGVVEAFQPMRRGVNGGGPGWLPAKREDISESGGSIGGISSPSSLEGVPARVGDISRESESDRAGSLSRKGALVAGLSGGNLGPQQVTWTGATNVLESVVGGVVPSGSSGCAIPFESSTSRGDGSSAHSGGIGAIHAGHMTSGCTSRSGCGSTGGQKKAFKGTYKCGRCGQTKQNHACPLDAGLIKVGSKSSQTDPRVTGAGHLHHRAARSHVTDSHNSGSEYYPGLPGSHSRDGLSAEDLLLPGDRVISCRHPWVQGRAPSSL